MAGVTDVSVRVAWAEDAAAIAALQLRAWPRRYAGLLPADVFPSGPGALSDAAASWRQALVRPADARQRALVALAGATVVGLAVTGPAVDPDRDPVAVGLLDELVIDPERLGEGHGSRLLQAAVDTLVADRFSRAVTWLPASDDALRRFLLDAGWAPDGAHRELEAAAGVRLKEVRLHTALA
ncbi:MAG TPA: GNAT family N-acetyltransferase [Nocardioides sp.]|uniref:GNAT family N-acetyltransferase n=1 Tax=Nocardioides sp. TaxID=35761 RepID=UPI002ED8CFF9